MRKMGGFRENRLGLNNFWFSQSSQHEFLIDKNIDQT